MQRVARWFLAAAFATIYVGLQQPGRAAVLGSGIITENDRIDGDFSSLEVSIGITSFPLAAETFIFDRTLAPTDVGLTSTVDSSSPQFAALAAYLTNGVNDAFETSHYFSFDAYREALVFFPGGGGPDFKGATISSVVFTVLSADFVYFQEGAPCDPSFPCGPDNGVSTTTTAQFNLRITVNGNADPVPEPGLTSTIGAGLLALGFLAKRRR